MLNRILYYGQIWLLDIATSSKIKSDVSNADTQLVKKTLFLTKIRDGEQIFKSLGKR